MGRHEPVRPGARLARGWLAGILSTSLAGLSHYATDAATPDLLLLLIAVAGASMVCVLLAGHRMGPLRVAVAVGVSQGAYHALFSVPAHASCAGAEGTGLEHAHHGAASAAVLDPVGCATPAAYGHQPMVAAHLLAAVVTYLMVRHGEKAWWALVDALRTQVVHVLALVLPVTPAARPVRRAGEFFHRELHDLASARAVILRRGPPAPVV